MKKILLIGAGRSASSLIDYLLKNAENSGYVLTVGDIDLELAKAKIKGHPRGLAIQLDLTDEVSLTQRIQEQDVVVSLAPAFLHMPIAKLCLKLSRSLFTASYVSPEMQALDAEVKEKGLLFLNEIGCDPGIDHMSALALKEKIEAEGGKIRVFCSYTGGLVAPESNDNPWGYKFSWNPRNVIVAGSAGAARYLQNNEVKYLPYSRLFRQTERFRFKECGEVDAYFNRDSVPYKELYGLKDAHTVIRGTFRYVPYCLAWNVMVNLGLTDDHILYNGKGKTLSDLLSSFLPDGEGDTRIRLQHFLKYTLSYEGKEMQEVMRLFHWLGMFTDQPLVDKIQSPAAHLQSILEDKWKLGPTDKDLVLMYHHMEAKFPDEIRMYGSLLYLAGKNEIDTAMAACVGWPLGIAVKRYLEGKIALTGVHIPNMPELYHPVLEELASMGIGFRERVQVLT